MEFPIDSRFLSSEGKAPFEHCLVCNKQVVESGEDYFIERIFRRLPDQPDETEAIFEYAMCAGCADDLRKELSESSRMRIEELFADRLIGKGVEDLGKSTDHCLLTGKPINAAQEYSYHAHCKHDKLIHSFFPYAISDEGMDEVSELLSNDTLGMLDDFKGKYFSGPPEIAELLNPKRFVPL